MIVRHCGQLVLDISRASKTAAVGFVRQVSSVTAPAARGAEEQTRRCEDNEGTRKAHKSSGLHVDTSGHALEF